MGSCTLKNIWEIINPWNGFPTIKIISNGLRFVACLFSQEEQNELKQLKIEEKDERNVALGNAAKARAYELMMWLYTISISLLAFFHIISLIAFFILLGVYVICQIYFIIRLYRYHKDL